MSAVMGEGTPGPARVGIGGPVGSGKTALIERLVAALTKRGVGAPGVTTARSRTRMPSASRPAA